MNTLFNKLTRISSITIPNYIREIEVSKKQRPKYFEWNGTTIKSKGKKLWKKCIKPQFRTLVFEDSISGQYLETNYKLVGFKNNIPYCIQINSKTSYQFRQLTDKQKVKPEKYILCIDDIEGTIVIEGERYSKVIANPTQVGTPRKQIISGQHLYSGILNEFVRNKIVRKLKESYARKFRLIDKFLLDSLINRLSNSYPIYIICEIQDTVDAWDDGRRGSKKHWDVPNRAFPYTKTFTDFLVEEGYIEDDDRLHLIGDGNFFTPIEHSINRKLIFHIYSDNRKIWKQYLKDE